MRFSVHREQLTVAMDARRTLYLLVPLVLKAKLPSIMAVSLALTQLVNNN